MGFFSKLFHLNEEEKKEKGQDIVDKKVDETNVNSNNIVVSKEIDTIINILANLGLLDSDNIEEKLETQGIDFDKSILKRLMIKTDYSKIPKLVKYFESYNLGYGIDKLNHIKEELVDLSVSKASEGKNYSEIVEELINATKYKIEEYENVLVNINTTINNIEENTKNESEVLAMVDYWTIQYKEQFLGYPINLKSKVDTMVIELKSLPYGGYGEIEIEKFVDSCQKLIQEGKNNNEDTNHTQSRIVSTLFEPKKSRYFSDLEVLKKKIDMIKASPFLSEDEVENNVKNAIIEFNIMCGHKVVNDNKEKENKKESPVEAKEEILEQKNDINEDNSLFIIEVNIQKLTSLDRGGYGPRVISEFRLESEKIMNSDIPLDEKYVQINELANLLISIYNSNLSIFSEWEKRQLEDVKDEDYLSKKQELDDKIKYMLSLTQEELVNYILEDDKMKKQEMDFHNKRAVFIYLLGKDGVDPGSEQFNFMMEDYLDGNNPYSEKEFKKAYDELEIKSLVNEVQGDEKLISYLDYIDSTLLKQISDIELELSNKTISGNI